MKYLKTALLITAMSIILILTSCQSIPKNVPQDLTRRELIQLAQNSYEEGNITAAEYYYQLVIERFGDDISSRIIAQYEIAHLHIKEKDYSTARPLLEEIVTAFDENQELAYTIPEYLKLAKIDLAKCEDK